MISFDFQSVYWTTLPIPKHEGVLISSAVSKVFSIDQIKEKLIAINLDTGFENLTQNIEIKMISKWKTDTFWIVKWTKRNNKYIALCFGSEF